MDFNIDELRQLQEEKLLENDDIEELLKDVEEDSQKRSQGQKKSEEEDETLERVLLEMEGSQEKKGKVEDDGDKLLEDVLSDPLFNIPEKTKDAFQFMMQQKKPKKSSNPDLSCGPLSLVEGESVGEVPASINANLRDYQKEGVKFLWKLYSKKKGAILADDM